MSQVNILTLFEVVLIVVVAYVAWKLNHRIAEIDQRAVRVALLIPVNFLAACVILILLAFVLFSSSSE